MCGHMPSRTWDIVSTYAGTTVRLGAGLIARAPARRPEKLLELYEFEACPMCRKVREALTQFDLDAKIVPCPKGGRHRERVRELGGKLLFPFLVDPNTGRSMYESNAIIAYLAETYAGRSVPLPLRLGPLTNVSSALSSLCRPTNGRHARASREPEKPLELYSFEASPYCRLARETLCELQLPYLLHNVGKRSESRPAFVARSGKMQVPYLVDPNTETSLFESAEIVRYLERTYASA